MQFQISNTIHISRLFKNFLTVDSTTLFHDDNKQPQNYISKLASNKTIISTSLINIKTHKIRTKKGTTQQFWVNDELILNIRDVNRVPWDPFFHASLTAQVCKKPVYVDLLESCHHNPLATHVAFIIRRETGNIEGDDGERHEIYLFIYYNWGFATKRNWSWTPKRAYNEQWS